MSETPEKINERPTPRGNFLFDIEGGRDNPLSVNVSMILDQIEITLEEDDPTYLNFSFLALYGEDGKPVGQGAEIECSPLHPSVKSFDLGFSSDGMNGYHSDFQKKPIYKITFRESIYISEVKIGNRLGRWGVRLLPLRINFLHSGQRVLEFRNYSPYRLEASLNKIRYQFDESDYLQSLLNSSHEFNDAFKSFVTLTWDQVCDPIIGAVTIDDFKRKLLDSMLHFPVPQGQRAQLARTVFLVTQRLGNYPLPSLDSDLLAFAIAVGIETEALNFHKLDVGNELVKWNSFYKNSNELKNLENRVRYFYSLLGFSGQPVISRHGWRVAALTIYKEQYLTLLTDVCKSLSGMGKEYFLSYGTLLGAIRASEFIPYDDDVDIAVPIRIKNESEIAVRLRDLCAELNAAGLKSVYDEQYKIIQISTQGIPTGVDVFPCTIFEDASGCPSMVVMHHRGMKLKEISSDYIFPLTKCVLEGSQFASPGKVKEFLLWRYGEGWNIPDQFFELDWFFNY